MVFRPHRKKVRPYDMAGKDEWARARTMAGSHPGEGAIGLVTLAC